MNVSFLKKVIAAGCFAFLVMPAIAQAQTQANVQTVLLTAKGFIPSEITIPAHTRVKVMVVNKTPLPAEFEGTDFPTEKVIPATLTLPVFLGPLNAGTYHFFNEFSPSVTGVLTVK